MGKFQSLQGVARIVNKFDCLFVVCVCLTMYVIPVLAGWGPCDNDLNGSLGVDKIRCSEGSCEGYATGFLKYTVCSEVDENFCANNKPVSQAYYIPKTVVDDSWSALLNCFGGNVACATCVATFGINPCLAVCDITVSFDFCCRVRCEPEYYKDIPFGHGCK